MSRQDHFERRPRVRWLAPSVLARTVKPLLLSALFARYSDRREVEAVLDQPVFDLTGGRDELWLDYVADTADGFDATATVASLLAPPTLTLPARAGGQPHATRAGSVLVLGGDEVYPFASLEEYKDRLIGPYRGMLPCSDPERVVVAVPGNHDWYDGLTAFLQVFCGLEWIGGWKTIQRRSYFACKLPQRWWLWGIDIQLDTYIDQPQLDYFRRAAEEIEEGDGVILCWAKPSWVKSGEERPEAYDTLDYFQRTIVPEHAHIRLALTGDSHHYARYEGPRREQKITAGLGGAFLSATHHLPETLLLPAPAAGDPPVPFRRQQEYPSCATSRSMRWGVLRSIHANDWFAALPAVAYGGLALAVTRRRRQAMTAAAAASILTAGCVAFAKPKKAAHAWPGLAHAAAHLGTAVGAIGLLGRQTRSLSEPGRRAVVFGGASAAGALCGPVLFALYLVAADGLGLFRRNTNELFAAQAIEGYKGFLRLHIRPDGGLTVYPIKVDEVSRWAPDGTWDKPPGAPRFRPDPKPAPMLIEEPLEVTRTP